MVLLIAVVNDPGTVDEILSGYLEIGITGATIINSEGMGRVLSHDIPIFAGLQTLISRSRPQNRTIFSVLKSRWKPSKNWTWHCVPGQTLFSSTIWITTPCEKPSPKWQAKTFSSKPVAT